MATPARAQKVGGVVAAYVLAACACGPGVGAFAPAVRSCGQQVLLPPSGSLGPRRGPPGGQKDERVPSAKSHAGAVAASADAAALSAEASAHTAAAKYDDTEFFESFMTSVISRVDEREELDLGRAPTRVRGAMKIMDGVVVAASCFMAMHVFSVWMALGVWVALRASSLLETASDAQALVVAFATGSPLDSASRQSVLSTTASNPRRAKWQRRAAEMFEEDIAQTLSLRQKRREAKELAGATAAPAPALAVPGKDVVMRGVEAGRALMSEKEQREKEQREMAARKARAELWELAKDVAFIGSYYTRQAAIKGVKKVHARITTAHAFSPSSWRAHERPWRAHERMALDADMQRERERERERARERASERETNFIRNHCITGVQQRSERCARQERERAVCQALLVYNTDRAPLWHTTALACVT